MPGIAFRFGYFVWELKFSTCSDFDEIWYVPIIWVADHESEVRFAEFLCVRQLFKQYFQKFWSIRKNDNFVGKVEERIINLEI